MVDAAATRGCCELLASPGRFVSHLKRKASDGSDIELWMQLEEDFRGVYARSASRSNKPERSCSFSDIGGQNPKHYELRSVSGIRV